MMEFDTIDGKKVFVSTMPKPEELKTVDAFDVFLKFTAIRIHFNDESYDYHRYHGKLRMNAGALMGRKDRHAFYKLARVIPPNDVEYFLAIAFHENKKRWVRDLFDARVNQQYLAHIKYLDGFKEGVAYIRELNEHCVDFRGLISPNPHQNPLLLDMVYHRNISLPTFAVMDYFMNLTNGWNNHLKGDPVWQDFYMRFWKWRNFFYNKINFFHNKDHWKDITLNFVRGSDGQTGD